VESGNNDNFLKSSSFPAKGYTKLLGCFFNELTYRLLHAGGDNVVFGFSLLKHHPLHADVILSMTPVAKGIQAFSRNN